MASEGSQLTDTFTGILLNLPSVIVDFYLHCEVGEEEFARGKGYVHQFQCLEY